MSGPALKVLRSHAGVTVQDKGREGFLAFGLSRSGAADLLALAEGAALLGQDHGCAAIEMAGFGAVFEAQTDLRIALTGAPMQADVDGARLTWNATHVVRQGQKLSVGAPLRGSYGYLHLGGGVASPTVLGSQSCHLAAGLGKALAAGDIVEHGLDPHPAQSLYLREDARFMGGDIRVVPSVQTSFFEHDLDRFQATAFQRGPRGNRMGAPLQTEGAGFESTDGLSILSEVIVPGDIQITGDGTPFVLLCECQTTGGYPRIASVLPSDLPRVAQAPAGSTLRFRFVSLAEAVEIETKAQAHLQGLHRQTVHLTRAPQDIADLLSYQLISGVTAGDDLDPA